MQVQQLLHTHTHKKGKIKFILVKNMTSQFCSATWDLTNAINLTLCVTDTILSAWSIGANLIQPVGLTGGEREDTKKNKGGPK